MIDQLFHDRSLYHTEISPLICRVYQWTGFYIIGIPVIEELEILFRSKNLLNSSHLKAKTYRDFHVDEILGKCFIFQKKVKQSNWIVELLWLHVTETETFKRQQYPITKLIWQNLAIQWWWYIELYIQWEDQCFLSIQLRGEVPQKNVEGLFFIQFLICQE